MKKGNEELNGDRIAVAADGTTFGQCDVRFSATSSSQI